jgi:hypothetical protein
MLNAPYFDDDSTARVAEGRLIVSEAFRNTLPTDSSPSLSNELHALVFRLDVAETVEALDEVAADLRDEMIRELKERQD